MSKSTKTERGQIAGLQSAGKSLTLEVARAFVDGRIESLTSYTSIECDAAEFLAYQAEQMLNLEHVSEMDRYTIELRLDGLCELSDKVAGALAKHPGYLHLNGIKCLSENSAKALVKGRCLKLSLNGLQTIPDSVAVVLGKCMADLNLDGLSSLSDEASGALAKSKSSLSLNGLNSLSDGAADALAKCKGGLSLNGLTRLPDSLAHHFTRFKGLQGLALNGLTDLTATTAGFLSKIKATLCLDGLKNLPDPVATALSKHREHLSLDGLTSLSDTAAAALAKHQGGLNLNGLASLSDKAAEELAKQKGALSLDGLTNLSDRAVTSLSKIPETLSLEGLKSVNDQAAAALSQHHGGYLALCGLTILGPQAAKALAKRKDGLSLRIESLSIEVAQALASYEGWLYIYGLKNLCFKAAESIAKSKAEVLGLDGFSCIDASVAQKLAIFRGKELRLDDIVDLPEEAAEAIARMKVEQIYLLGLRSLSPGAAKALAKFKGRLIFGRLDQPTREALQVAKQSKARRSISSSSESELGDLNDTGDLTSLTVDAAKTLAASDLEDLDLRGLTALDEELAEALADFSGDAIWLDGLTSISDRVAKHLASFRGNTLGLNGLENLSEAAAGVLASFAGPDLQLAGLQKITRPAAQALANYEWEWFGGSGVNLSPAIKRAIKSQQKHFVPLKRTGITTKTHMTRNKSTAPESKPSASKNLGNRFSVMTLESMLQKQGDFEKRIVRWDSASALDECRGLPKRMREARAQQLEGRIRTCDFSDYAEMDPEGASSLVKSLRRTLLVKGFGDSDGGHGEDCSLDLSGLQSIDEDTARLLSKYNGIVILNGLLQLPLEAARHLAKMASPLHLSGLKSLSADLANALRLHRGWELHLNGLQTLEHEAAEALTKNVSGKCRKLFLDSVKSISDEVAKLLSKRASHIDLLSLKGLEELSEAAADELIAVENIQVKERVRKSLQAAQRRWRKKCS